MDHRSIINLVALKSQLERGAWTLGQIPKSIFAVIVCQCLPSPPRVQEIYDDGDTRSQERKHPFPIEWLGHNCIIQSTLGGHPIGWFLRHRLTPPSRQSQTDPGGSQIPAGRLARCFGIVVRRRKCCDTLSSLVEGHENHPKRIEIFSPSE